MNQLPQIERREKMMRLFGKAKKQKCYWVEWHWVGEKSYQVTHATGAGLASMEADPMVEIVRVSRA